MPRRSSLLQPIIAISQIVSVVLPPIAAVLGVRSVLLGNALDLGLVGVLMAVAAVLAAGGIVASKGRPENSHPRTMRKIGLIHLIASAGVGSIGVFALVTGQTQEGWGLVGIVMDAAVGIILVATNRVPKNEQADVIRRAAVNLQKRTDALTARQKDEIVGEVRLAVAILAERGLIEVSEVAKAQDAPAGYLSLRMLARSGDTTP